LERLRAPLVHSDQRRSFYFAQQVFSGGDEMSTTIDSLDIQINTSAGTAALNIKTLQVNIRTRALSFLLLPFPLPLTRTFCLSQKDRKGE